MIKKILLTTLMLMSLAATSFAACSDDQYDHHNRHGHQNYCCGGNQYCAGAQDQNCEGGYCGWNYRR